MRNAFLAFLVAQETELTVELSSRHGCDPTSSVGYITEVSFSGQFFGSKSKSVYKKKRLWYRRICRPQDEVGWTHLPFGSWRSRGLHGRGELMVHNDGDRSGAEEGALRATAALAASPGHRHRPG